MTVATDTNRKTFAGNGVSTSFATSPLVFFTSSDLIVTVTNDTTGAVTTLTENTHYSVSGGGTPAAVGTVSLAGGSSPYGAPAAGVTVTILRDVSVTQDADYVQNDGSDAEVSEAALDRLTMIAQRLGDRLDRALHLPDGDVDGLVTELPDSVTRALGVLGFDADGSVTTYDPASTVTAGSNVSFTAPGTGAVATNEQDRGQQQRWLWDYLSIAQRAAIAATGTTDCSAAIQAAHDALPTGGGVINIGPGGFAIGTTVTLSKPITLRGEGSNNQTLTRLFKLSTLSGPALYATAANVTVENFVLAGQAGNAGNGITVENQYFTARNVQVIGMGQDGIRIGKDAGQNSNLWSIQNCRLTGNTRHGLYLHDGGANAGAGLASRSFFDTNGGDGVKTDSADLNTFIGCTSESNTGYGVNWSSASSHDNWWFGGDIEANTAGQVNRATGATRNNVIGPTISYAIGARVYNNTNITIADSTSTALTFNSERFDTDDIHSTSVNPSRLTCVTPGKYQISATIAFAANATGRRELSFKLNGTTFIGGQMMPTAIAAAAVYFNATTLYDLVAGDYVEVFVFQNSTGNLDVVNSANYSPEFMMIRQN